MTLVPPSSPDDPDLLRKIRREAAARRAAVHLVARDFGGVDLYVGDRHGASDPALLARYGIVMVLNCAVNLDINLVDEVASEARHTPFGRAGVRYFKLGMVDGLGNPPEMLMAGYLQLRALMAQTIPEKASYPCKARGHVLVNCRGGRSRSVILAALFLHLERPDCYETLDDALFHVRRVRRLDEREWGSAPKLVLIDGAREALRMLLPLRARLGGIGL